MFSNNFPKIASFIMSKNIVETEGPQMTSQYGANALRAGLARLLARMRMRTPTRPRTHMHARTRKHAHTDQYVILIALPQQQWFDERASMLQVHCMSCSSYAHYIVVKQKVNWLGRISRRVMANKY
jgi:hypothetical protein